MPRVRVSIAIAATALTISSTSWAWGPNGHAIVADIAVHILSDPVSGSPSTLGQISPLLPGAMTLDPATTPAKQLSDIASAPDAYRANNHNETSQWHFVDIPLGVSPYDEARDCHYPPKHGAPRVDDLTCIVAILPKFVTQLSDTSRSATDRGQALAFVVHFVGDIHQPLHAETKFIPSGADDDLGGNTLKLVWRNDHTNLHAIWDSNIIDGHWGLPVAYPSSDPNKNYKVDLGPAAAVAVKLDPTVCPDKPSDWVQPGVTHDMATAARAWANQSHSLAQAVYDNLPPNFPPGWEDTYAKYASPVIECQLQRAGARLAQVLREALP